MQELVGKIFLLFPPKRAKRRLWAAKIWGKLKERLRFWSRSFGDIDYGLCSFAFLNKGGVGGDDVGYLLGVFTSAVGVTTALDNCIILQ